MTSPVPALQIQIVNMLIGTNESLEYAFQLGAVDADGNVLDTSWTLDHCSIYANFTADPDSSTFDLMCSTLDDSIHIDDTVNRVFRFNVPDLTDLTVGNLKFDVLLSFDTLAYRQRIFKGVLTVEKGITVLP